MPIVIDGPLVIKTRDAPLKISLSEIHLGQMITLAECTDTLQVRLSWRGIEQEDGPHHSVRLGPYYGLGKQDACCIKASSYVEKSLLAPHLDLEAQRVTTVNMLLYVVFDALAKRWTECGPQVGSSY